MVVLFQKGYEHLDYIVKKYKLNPPPALAANATSCVNPDQPSTWDVFK